MEGLEGLQQWRIQAEEWLRHWRIQAEEWLHHGIVYIHQIPPTQLYAAIAVLLLTTLMLLSSKSP